MITLRPKPGQDNDRFVETRVKKLKKIMMNDRQLKEVFYPQYFEKPSKRKHDRESKRRHIRQKFGELAYKKGQPRPRKIKELMK